MAKATSIPWLVVLLALGAPIAGLAQASFTRITEGSIVTDTAANFKRPIWGDYNNDGYLDLFVNNYGGTNFLYRNNRDGTFTRVRQSEVAGRADTYPSPSWVDFDNDGNLDLFVPAGFVATLNDVFSKSPRYTDIFRNNGDETFSRVTGSAITDQKGYYCGAALDYDNDGWVDLLVGDIPDSGKLRLHHNEGGFTFVPAGPEAMPADSVSPWAGLFADFDNDGYTDVLIVEHSGGGTNRFYHNAGNGAFSRVTNAISSERWPGSAFGYAADVGDFDNDGFPDVFIAASGTPNRLYRNNGDGSFTKLADAPMSRRRSASQSAGCAWGDYDDDGYLDLFVSNIHGRNQLFRNNRDGTFSEVHAGEPVTEGHSTSSYFGASWADYDNDGFLDLFVAGGITDTAPGKNLLYHNNGNTNSWLEVRCVGTVSNRSALGAKVRVFANLWGRGVWQLREIDGGFGYWSHPLVTHFGTGDATNVTTVRIEWPSGTVQELQGIGVNQILTVIEPPRLLADLSNNQPRFTLRGGRGIQYQIESSTDLGVWIPVGTPVMVEVGGTAALPDSVMSRAGARFYRAVQRLH